MKKLEKLNIDEFKNEKLLDNHLRQISGGGTTWEGDGESGTDWCVGNKTHFSDESTPVTDPNTCG